MCTPVVPRTSYTLSSRVRVLFHPVSLALESRIARVTHTIAFPRCEGYKLWTQTSPDCTSEDIRLVWLVGLLDGWI